MSHPQQKPNVPRRALLYTRVSTDEQADRGYSLRDQEARLRQYCRREGIDVVGHYQDDHSAKTFERPAWKKLVAFIKANWGAADVLLVVKWDRFSRDATGALSMIRTLEELGVRVQAAEQPVDLSIPEQMMMLAIYVAAPEVENRRRSIATKAGMRRAMREGRYCNVPPKGYRRDYDETGRMLIVPSEDAAFVREAFELAARHVERPMEVIRRHLREKGFRCSTNQFTLLLRNPLYADKIHLPAWQGPSGYEPEQLVDGVHEALVPFGLWRQVQARFEAPYPSRGRSKRFLPDLPMRGHLVCPRCFGSGEARILTGSASRSKTGRRYWYYHCRKGCRERCRASRIHEAAETFLGSIEIAPEVRRLYRRIAGELARSEQARRRSRR